MDFDFALAGASEGAPPDSAGVGPMRRTAKLGIVLLLLTGCSPISIRDYEGRLPGAHPSTGELGGGRAVFVVSERTGVPLEGVEVRLLRQNTEPYRALSSQVGRFLTDRYGLVWVPSNERFRDCAWVFSKPGFAPRELFGFRPLEDEVVELRDGHRVEGRILGPEGRPSAGAEVEYFVALHTVRIVTTDASGWFSLSDVTPEVGFFWTAVPGALAEVRETALGPQSGFVLEPIQLRPGVVERGRVMGSQGQPVAGAVVFSSQSRRGPRTVANRNGEFSLVGLSDDAVIHVHPPSARIEPGSRSRTPEPATQAPPARPNHKLRIRPWGRLSDYLWFAVGQNHVPIDEAGDEGRQFVEVEADVDGPVRVRFMHREYGEGSLVADVSGALTLVQPEDFPRPATVRVESPPDWRRAHRRLGIEVHRLHGWEQVRSDALPTAFVAMSFGFSDGAAVRITGECLVESYHELHGAGPYLIRLGTAGIDLQVINAERFVAIVNGALLGSYESNDPDFADGSGAPVVFELSESDSDDEPGRVRIGGLAAGECTVLIGAQGRASKLVRIELKSGVTRRVVVEVDSRTE